MNPKAGGSPSGHPPIARNSEHHRQLALTAANEAAHALPLFEASHPDDPRPRLAVEAIRAWAQGERQLGMVEVRKLSLDSHAAARSASSDAARFAARAAGQAVATWHVPGHAAAVPMYVAKAIAANTTGRPAASAQS